MTHKDIDEHKGIIIEALSDYLKWFDSKCSAEVDKHNEIKEALVFMQEGGYVGMKCSKWGHVWKIEKMVLDANLTGFIKFKCSNCDTYNTHYIR